MSQNLVLYVEVLEVSWGSDLLGDDFDFATNELDIDKIWVEKQLSTNPILKHYESLERPESPESESAQLSPVQFDTAGWFTSRFDKDANQMVKELRKKRRLHKQHREEIDDAIDLIRGMKKMEVDSLLNSIPWSHEHQDTMKQLGLSERNLKALRKHAIAREVSLKQACLQWENANDVISKLSQVTGDFSEEQASLWVEALAKRDESKKMWRNTLHQSDSLTKKEVVWLESASDVLGEFGAMDSRTILHHIHQHDARNTGLTTQRLGALLKMHGDDFDIVKNTSRWEKATVNDYLILKDPWAYTAGFLDADGYITITKRGEGRAGIIATGDRGRLHCEQLHKTLGCGVLQLDLKLHKNSKRSQHRLQFYSKDDLQRLLKNTRPFLQLKKKQADCVLELLDLRGRSSDLVKQRRDDLYRVVKWENWRDVKAEELLNEWNVDEQEVASWAQEDPEMIKLVDEASTLVGDV